MGISTDSSDLGDKSNFGRHEKSSAAVRNERRPGGVHLRTGSTKHAILTVLEAALSDI